MQGLSLQQPTQHLSDVSRREQWEQGRIDYTGADSFQFIQQTINSKVVRKDVGGVVDGVKSSGAIDGGGDVVVSKPLTAMPQKQPEVVQQQQATQQQQTTQQPQQPLLQSSSTQPTQPALSLKIQAKSKPINIKTSSRQPLPSPTNKPKSPTVTVVTKARAKK